MALRNPQRAVKGARNIITRDITLSSSNRGGWYFMSAAETGFHAKMKKYDQTLNVWFLGYNSYFGWYYIIRNKFDRKIFQKLYSFYELIFGHLYTSCHMYWTQRQKLWLKFSPFGQGWQTWNLHELKKTSSLLKRASIWVRRSMQTITILRTPHGYKVCILTLQMKIWIKRSSRGILTFTLSILVQENYSNLLQII